MDRRRSRPSIGISLTIQGSTDRTCDVALFVPYKIVRLEIRFLEKSRKGLRSFYDCGYLKDAEKHPRIDLVYRRADLKLTNHSRRSAPRDSPGTLGTRKSPHSRNNQQSVYGWATSQPLRLIFRIN